MNHPQIGERLQEALIRLKDAAKAVVFSDLDVLDERLLDELSDAASAAEDVLAGKNP